MTWEHPEEGYSFLRYGKDLATATRLDDGRWRWEVYRNTYMDIDRDGWFDRDGWWGICSTEELAQKEAERYLGL